MKPRGSVTELGDSFRVRIEIEPKNGKRRWDTKLFDTREEAEKYRTKVLAALDADRYVRTESMTFDSLCDRYLKASAGRIEATSVRWYERILRDHVRPTLGHRRLSTITRFTFSPSLTKRETCREQRVKEANRSAQARAAISWSACGPCLLGAFEWSLSPATPPRALTPQRCCNANIPSSPRKFSELFSLQSSKQNSRYSSRSRSLRARVAARSRRFVGPM